MKGSGKTTGGTLATLLLIAATVLYQHFTGGNGAATAPATAHTGAPATTATWRPGEWLEVQGRVQRVLPDDREGSPHERFILRTDDGRTLLIAHNIDLAPRVPVQAGGAVTLRGRFEPNERGGVIHWTHHDPEGRSGGWIDYQGKRYQ